MWLSQPKQAKQTNLYQCQRLNIFNNNICVFETLKEYIFRAKPWREKSNYTQLLLSHIVSLSFFVLCVFFIPI